jgi:DNA end-binding protein Ku
VPDDETREETEDERDELGGAAPRPFWSGTLSFGLVSIPVSLFPAVRRTGVSLRTIAEDGTPLARRYYCPAEDVEVDAEHLTRGFELDDGSYVTLSDDELEAADPKKSRDIDLRLFVPADQIDPIFFDRTYVLTSASESTKAYRLLAQVMERERRAGIATFVMRESEYVIAIFAERGLLHGQTLRFADEVRAAEGIGVEAGTKVDRSSLAAFRRAIAKAEADFDPEEFSDVRAGTLRARLERKLKAGEGVMRAPDEEPVERGEIIDLMEVLKRNLQASTEKEGAGTGRAPSPRARSRSPHAPARTGPSARELDRLSKEELYERAKQLGVEGRSQMNKAQLAREVSKWRAG